MELLHEQAYVFTSPSFGGGGACYGLISAQKTKLNGNKEMSVSARRFALPSANDTLTVLERAHNLSLRMFL